MYKRQDLENIDWQELSNLIIKIIEEIRKLPIAENKLNLVFYPFNQPSFWENFINRTVDKLVFEYLNYKAPIVIGLFRVIGVVNIQEIEKPILISEDSYDEDIEDDYGDCILDEEEEMISLIDIDWNALVLCFSDPVEFFTSYYSWGSVI